MPYGTPDQVADKARPFSEDGHWMNANEDYDLPGTNPSLSAVTQWLSETSSQMDTALGQNWFVTPVDPNTCPEAYEAISGYVTSLVADQCYLVNGVDRQVSPTGRILKDMLDWVSKNADGWISKGLTQKPSPSQKNQASFRVIGGFS